MFGANATAPKLDPNQELVAYGASSVGAGLSGGIVVSGSLSKTAANKEAGATSQISYVVNAATVLLTLAVLAPLFTNLPDATLGAIVIHPDELLPGRPVGAVRTVPGIERPHHPDLQALSMPETRRRGAMQQCLLG